MPASSCSVAVFRSRFFDTVCSFLDLKFVYRFCNRLTMPVHLRYHHSLHLRSFWLGINYSPKKANVGVVTGEKKLIFSMVVAWADHLPCRRVPPSTKPNDFSDDGSARISGIGRHSKSAYHLPL